MDIIAIEFSDMISGRAFKFKKTTAEWPNIEVQRHDWMNPFKEGGNNKIDEITLRVSTIAHDAIYFEEYTIDTNVNNTSPNLISELLHRKLIERVKSINKILQD